MSEGAPLRGRRLLLTRRREQGAALATRLQALGAEVVQMPLIEVAPPEDPASLEAALAGLAAFDWIAFTSANAVQAVRARRESLAGPRVASVGPATTEALSASFPGLPIDLVPESRYRAEGLLEAFAGAGVRGQRVLLPLSDRARDTLARGLRELGATPVSVTAYRTVLPAGGAEELRAEIARGLDLVVLASPSAVEGYALLAGPDAGRVRAAVMGPVTHQAAEAAGLDVAAVATPSTSDGLLDAIVGALGR